MTKRIRFTKMHGAGNDYIYIDTSKYPVGEPEKLSTEWSKYHTGIGSDGLVLIGPSEKADFSMHIYNADGSEAMMCGNATRCIGKYVYDYGLTDKTEVSLETLSGIKHLTLHIKEGKVAEVTTEMGEPAPELVNFAGNGKEEMIRQPITVDGETYIATAISMGNPHLVIFVEDISQVELEKTGPKLENHPFFPDRINIEFAQVLSDKKIRMRVWERGSGITMACGTGACATAVAGKLLGKTEAVSEIVMDGGTLTINWDQTTNKVLMTGPAATVFDGEIDL
ncbi:MAG: diaminopimelate epimerase [Bacteroides sp.]|nr:diaminopimelate epimerase [Bacteroides sp.]